MGVEHEDVGRPPERAACQRVDAGAKRQGLDLSALPDENEDEDEGKERWYQPRVLETNADRYRGEDDEELASTYIFLALAAPGELLTLDCICYLSKPIAYASLHLRTYIPA